MKFIAEVSYVLISVQDAFLNHLFEFIQTKVPIQNCVNTKFRYQNLIYFEAKKTSKLLDEFL